MIATPTVVETNRAFRRDLLPRILATAGAQDGTAYYQCRRCATLLHTNGKPPERCLLDQGGCDRPSTETVFSVVSTLGASPEAIETGIMKVAQESNVDPARLRELAAASFALSGEVVFADMGDYARLVSAYRRCFRTADVAPLDVALAAVATARVAGDPLWVYIVGPPSSGKTEVLRAFDGLPSTYFLSSLTPNALISGLKDGRDLLPDLDRKTLIVKDLTQTLEMARENRDALFGVLRDCFDGFASKAFGTVGTKSFVSHFNLVAAVTSAIEDYYTVQAVLGQRFVIVRTAFPDDFETDADRDIEAVRAEMRSLARAVIESVADADPPNFATELVREVKGLAREVALLRTHVHRDGYSHEITSLPEPEASARITNQLLKLAQGLAIVRRKSEVTDEEIAVVRRVARDTVPGIRIRLLEAVSGGATTIDLIAMTTGLPRRTVERKVEDLVILGILLEDASSKPYVYTPAKDFVLLAPHPLDPPSKAEVIR